MVMGNHNIGGQNHQIVVKPSRCVQTITSAVSHQLDNRPSGQLSVGGVRERESEREKVSECVRDRNMDRCRKGECV